MVAYSIRMCAQLASCYSNKLSVWTSPTEVITQLCYYSTSILTFFFLIHKYTREFLPNSVDNNFCSTT